MNIFQQIKKIFQKNKLESLIGKNVLLMCMNYFYIGRLVDVNELCAELEDAGVLFDAGEMNAENWRDYQKFGHKTGNHIVMISAIESFAEVRM